MHIINKLAFELECPAEEQAFDIRRDFYPASHEQIAAVIDSVCSKYVTDSESIRIDKLEIYLGEFSLSSFEQEFSKVFKRKFDAIIAERISQIPKEKLIGSKINNDMELLEYFLLKGNLPWWCDENTLVLDEISRNVFKNRQIEISEFFRNNYKNSALWERASYQLDENVLAVLVQMFEELRFAQKFMEAIFEIIREEINTTEESYRSIIAAELEQLSKTSVNILVSNASLIFAESRDAQKLRSVMADLVLKKLASLNNMSKMQETEISKLFESIKKRQISSGDISTDNTMYITNDDFSESGVDITGNIDLQLNIRTFKAVEEEKEKLTVRHAGMILLAPYLKAFFSKLDLLNENLWINKDAQYRGLYLLKYLSSGIVKTFEYQLILEKLLCGIALEQPVPSGIILSENEIEESDLLLNSVIEHWKALKNTSVNGLRETFLKRDGIIMRTEDGWLLQVERKTVDVLLESIPWGFGAAKLPWNEYIIVTEW